MAPFGALQIAQMNLRIPRGHDAYWRLIRDLDAKGPWTIAMLVDQTNVSTRTISVFVERLRKAGLATEIETRQAWPAQKCPAKVYRLTRRPVETPRLSRDGVDRGETKHQVLWRTMKMLKAFTPTELAELASSEQRVIPLSTVRQYVSRLTCVGVLAAGKVPNRTTEARYRLVRNLGARAPMILHTHVVFVPNSNVVVGEAEAREVSP